ncbi:uncharacterized protein LOC144862735 [Branchiostoma floridae x Branchiostoma japonicum]
MYATDSALTPDQIQSTWRLWVDDTHGFASFLTVKASCAECRQLTISGSDHFQEARMTTYSLTNQINDDRPVYSSDTTTDFFYFYGAYDQWMVGPTVGSTSRGLTAGDSHLYPEQITSVWNVYDGYQWVPYPRVKARCTDIDDCASSPCQNDGVCTDLHNSYTCTCSSIWEGDNCELDKNECATVTCNVGYVCVNHPGHYVCVPRGLNLGRGGSNLPACSTRSCADGWTCEARERGYACLPNQ